MVVRHVGHEVAAWRVKVLLEERAEHGRVLALREGQLVKGL